MSADEIQKLAKRVYRRLGLHPEHVEKAKTVEFVRLGWHDTVLWGGCRGAAVHVDLSGKLPQEMFCSCGERLKPCIHAIAIVMRAKDDMSELEEREPERGFKDQARYDPTWE